MVLVLERSVDRVQLSLDKPQQGQGGDLKSAHKLFIIVCDTVRMLHEWRTWPLCSRNRNAESRGIIPGDRRQQKLIKEWGKGRDEHGETGTKPRARLLMEYSSLLEAIKHRYDCRKPWMDASRVSGRNPSQCTSSKTGEFIGLYAAFHWYRQESGFRSFVHTKN